MPIRYKAPLERGQTTVNVLEELDYAVQLGILTLPALAIDGELVFSSLPTERQLESAVTKRTTSGAPHGL